MKDRYSRILKYLIFDRKKEFFSLSSEEELIDQFFYFDSKFTKYNGEEFMSKKDVPKFMDVVNNGSK